MKKITEADFSQISKLYSIELAMLKTFWRVESSENGFDEKTDKIIIQFEPEWFKKLFFDWEKSSKTSLWIVNKVEGQSKEWLAFNSAYGIDPDAAMQATSIGAPQIMGFHYKRLGFKSVGEMWNFFKESEKNQLICLVRFIQTDKRLWQAVKEKNFHLMACYYNGMGYKAFAKREKTVPYNEKLSIAYKSFSQTT